MFQEGVRRYDYRNTIVKLQNERQRNSARPAVHAARAQVRCRAPARPWRGDEFLSAAARHLRPSFGRTRASLFRHQHARPRRFVINTRGHDWINRAGDLTDFCGATYEKFEDSAQDFDGALDCLSQQGYKRFILVGHSLGCIKSLLYQGTRRRQDVIGVISCSCPKQFYSARAAEQPEFKAIMEQAESMVAAGKGKEFLWARASGAMAIFSAETFVNKYGKHENNDVRPHAGRLGCPHLAIAGGAEHPFFPEYAQELAQAGGASASYKIVPGSDHFYHDHEAEVIEILADWLKQFKS